MRAAVPHVHEDGRPVLPALAGVVGAIVGAPALAPLEHRTGGSEGRRGEKRKLPFSRGGMDAQQRVDGMCKAGLVPPYQAVLAHGPAQQGHVGRCVVGQAGDIGRAPGVVARPAGERGRRQRRGRGGPGGLASGNLPKDKRVCAGKAAYAVRAVHASRQLAAREEALRRPQAPSVRVNRDAAVRGVRKVADPEAAGPAGAKRLLRPPRIRAHEVRKRAGQI